MQYPFTFTSFLRPEFPTRCVSQWCVSHASKIARLMVEQYNDGNEVSVLINSPERKLSRLSSPSMPARVVSSHESFNETTTSGSPAKPTFLPAWRSPGSPLITTQSRLNVDVYSARRKFAKWINDCYVLRASFLNNGSWCIFRVIDSNSRFS